MLFRSIRLRPTFVALLVLFLAVTTIAGPGLAQKTTDLNPGPATPNPIGPAVPGEIEQFAADWPAPQGNLAGTRAAADSPISTDTVDQLAVAWTWPIEATGNYGGMTAPPIVVDDTIYVQDMDSNVYALDRATGDVKWSHEYNITTIGPNGVAIGYGMVYGGLGDSAEAFALDAETGEEVWRIDLNNNPGMGIDMAPTVYDNKVFISTVPGISDQFYEGGQTGILYALDAQSGAILWPFDTTTDNLWGMPAVNSGGGVWYPPSVDDDGNVYFGTGNPAPWPGVVAFGTPFPNGSSRPGPNDYTNSVVSLDSSTGALHWHHNAKPHDLFDLDFQNTPVLVTLPIDGTDTKVAFGSGKTGTVIAYNADTGDILWETAVGTHENDDVQEIPEGETIRVYPGALGGVETPIAYADGTIFVPIVNRWNEYTALEQGDEQPLTEATGEFVALNAADGSVKWQVELPQMALGAATVANDVVFTADLTGKVYAFDTETGDEVWSYQANAGINAPPANAGDLLLVPAAGPLLGGPEGTQAEAQLIALRLGATGTPEAATPAADRATSAATPAAGATPVPEANMVGVELTEFEIRMPDELPAGETTFEVTNVGSVEHNFEVEGQGIEEEFAENLAPGETKTMTLDLEAGTYEVYCPVGDHAEQGMRLELAVTDET
ncbi:MAG: PQQ-binding-like beta-propeller repeat protein [Chloroflexi bacterium]|nr:PQQ-binding-like beta-propeller repeat protein [Chloroflexota bacterium]